MAHFKAGTPGEMYWFAFDRKGDVAGLTKHSGQATHNYRYDPYGAVLPEHGNFVEPHNRYTLTGKHTDENTGLVWFGARHYDPSNGVWLTQDVYRGTIDRPPSLHRLAYVTNNPTNGSDYYGYLELRDSYNVVNAVLNPTGYAIEAIARHPAEALGFGKGFVSPFVDTARAVLHPWQTISAIGTTLYVGGGLFLNEAAQIGLHPIQTARQFVHDSSTLYSAIRDNPAEVKRQLLDETVGGYLLKQKLAECEEDSAARWECAGEIAGSITEAVLISKGFKALKALESAKWVAKVKQFTGGVVDDIVDTISCSRMPAAVGTSTAPRALLAPVKMQQHHIFPQKFRDFFQARGVDIDKFTVEISQGRHLRSVHGRGDAITPGRFNQRWSDFIEANPNATAKEIYQFGGRLMDEYGLSNLPIIPYR